MENEDKLLRALLGKHYMNHFGVIHSFNEIPKPLRRIFGKDGEDSNIFKNFFNKGQFFWIKKDDKFYLAWIGNDGELMISDNGDRIIQPQRFELEMGLSMLNISIQEFLERLLEKDRKITESDMNRLVKQIISKL